MKKLLLALTLGTTLVAGAQTTPPSVTYNWSAAAVATNGTASVTTAACTPAFLEDGSTIGAFTNSLATKLDLGGKEIDVPNDGMKGTNKLNITIAKFDATGDVKWSMTSSFGEIKLENSFVPAVVPGKDLALIAFGSGFNLSTYVPNETSTVIFKIKDAKGVEFSAPMECPSDYRPVKNIILLFKPSDGSIVALKTIESEYIKNSANKYTTQPLYITGAVATTDAFYITGYANSKTTFAPNVVFNPTGVAEGSGGTGYEKSFTVKYSLDGTATKITTDVATTENYEKTYLIGTDGTYFYTVGQTAKTAYGFAYTKDLVKVGQLSFPLSNPTSGNPVLQLRQLNVTATGLYVSGAIKGGFEGTNLTSNGLDTDPSKPQNHGFVAHINPATKKIIGGYVDPKSISAYMGCYLIKDKYFVPGYNLGDQSAFLQPLSTNWNANDKITLATTTSSITSNCSTAFDSSNNKLIINVLTKDAKLGETTMLSAVGYLTGLYACYTIDAGSGVDNVVANEGQVKVEGGNGCINITAGAPAQVNIYNVAGVCVKSVSVDGNCSVALAPGLYIAAGKKVAVK